MSPLRAFSTRRTVTPEAGESAAAIRLPGTGLLFLAYLTVLAIEYGGLGDLVPILKITRTSTLLAWGVTIAVCAKVGWPVFGEFRQSRMLLLLVLWTGASVLWAVVQSYVPANFRFMCDYFGLFVGTLYLIDRPSRIRQLSILMSLLIIFLVFRNLGMLNASLRMGSFRAGYFMGDGNDFGWGLATMMLFPVFLLREKHFVLFRLLGIAALGVGIVGVIGTGSRGASLAILGALVFHWLFLSKHRFLDLAAAVMLLVGVATFAPSGYLVRMRSIENYEEEGSAQGRLRAWRSAMRMAVDYPLGVGAGNFNSAYGRFYRPDNLQGWAANRWISAHSVYFKVLGEYGIVGFIALLTIIFSNITDSLRVMHRIRSNPNSAPISDQWPAAVGLGMVGYSVGAIFLGGVTYPHLFVLSGLSLSSRRLLTAQTATKPRAARATAVAMPAAALALTSFSFVPRARSAGSRD